MNTTRARRKLSIRPKRIGMAVGVILLPLAVLSGCLIRNVHYTYDDSRAVLVVSAKGAIEQLDPIMDGRFEGGVPCRSTAPWYDACRSLNLQRAANTPIGNSGANALADTAMVASLIVKADHTSPLQFAYFVRHAQHHGDDVLRVKVCQQGTVRVAVVHKDHVYPVTCMMS